MKFEKAMNHTITIEASHNGGYLVNVGCCRLVYADRTSLIADFADFIEDPKGVEEKYYRFCGNDVEGTERQPDCQPDPPSRGLTAGRFGRGLNRT